ncbi:hypothetical protein CYLTODRAFT_413495 [Cylindrobasidium torrendii FP15055 ss-10]|uniref:Uncharacterized protein n=1 Tax=Cylindrobasidium torrendii FP15055 ss-10 TaxID=1314674 RepID=A0A0D7B213_9AGAR|nr:hypothetical protein CYLTODRAFT_413495 [Cylindrobasidium torrendii FP15055 ss-10]
MSRADNSPATHILCDSFGAGNIASFTTFVVGPNMDIIDYHTEASDAIDVPERTLGTDLVQNLAGILFHPQLAKGAQDITIYLTSPHIFNIVQAIFSCEFDIDAIAAMLPGELRGTVNWLVVGIVDCLANNSSLSFRQILKRDADSINEFRDLGTLARTLNFPIGDALVTETLRLLNGVRGRPELLCFSYILTTILNGASTKPANGYSSNTSDTDCDPALVIGQARELEKRRLDDDEATDSVLVTSSDRATSSSPSVYGTTPARPSFFETSSLPIIHEDSALFRDENSANDAHTTEPPVVSDNINFGSLPSQTSQRSKATRRIVLSPIRLGIKNVYSARSPSDYSPGSPSPFASRANASIMAVLDFPVSPVASTSRLGQSLLDDWEISSPAQEEDTESVVNPLSSPPPARPRDQTGLHGRNLSPITTPSGRVINRKRRLSADFQDFTLSAIAEELRARGRKRARDDEPLLPSRSESVASEVLDSDDEEVAHLLRPSSSSR